MMNTAGLNIRNYKTSVQIKLEKLKQLTTNSGPRKFWNDIKSIFRSKKPSNFAVSREWVNCFVDYFSNIVNKMKSVAFPITNFV